MASLSFLFFLISILISSADAQKGLTLPIRKDPKTSQFYTTIQMGSNRATIRPIIDLGSPFLWFTRNDYTSNTSHPVPCDSAKCDLAKGGGCAGCNQTLYPGCNNDSCWSYNYNPFQNVTVAEWFWEDVLYFKDRVLIPQFLFSFLDSDYARGLATGANGLLGLARTQISFHKQVAVKFKLADKFSVCFPSSGLGKLSIGVSSSSKSLKTTPLIINPVSTLPFYSTEPSFEYFIDVKSIRVNGVPLSVRNSYFAIDKHGVGGTKISTRQNYTSLHNSIYKPFTRAFVKAAADTKIKSVAAVVPFGACFSSKSISRTPAGPSVPEIDLVLPGKDVYWRINGANSLVEIDRRTTCLAFVDAGKSPRTSIVIGVHQLEENLLEFDLVSNQLLFSSSLLVQNKSCSRL